MCVRAPADARTFTDAGRAVTHASDAVGTRHAVADRCAMCSHGRSDALDLASRSSASNER